MRLLDRRIVLELHRLLFFVTHSGRRSFGDRQIFSFENGRTALAWLVGGSALMNREMGKSREMKGEKYRTEGGRGVESLFDRAQDNV